MYPLCTRAFSMVLVPLLLFSVLCLQIQGIRASGPISIPLHILSKWTGELVEELRLRKNSFTSYRNVLVKSFEKSFDNFKNDRLKLEKAAERNAQYYTKRLNILYNETMETLKSQNAALDALKKLEKSTVVSYDSFDQFRKAYEESLQFFKSNTYSYKKVEGFRWRLRKADPKIQKIPSVSFSKRWFANTREKNKKFYSKQRQFYNTTKMTTEPFSTSINKLTERLQKQIDSVSQSLSLKTEEQLRALSIDIAKFDEDINKNARAILEKSEEVIQSTFNKRVMKRENSNLQLQLNKLEKDVSKWLDNRVLQLAATVKTLQETLSDTTAIYDQLQSKRKNNIYYMTVSDDTLIKVLDLVDPKNPGTFFFKPKVLTKPKVYKPLANTLN